MLVENQEMIKKTLKMNELGFVLSETCSLARFRSLSEKLQVSELLFPREQYRRLRVKALILIPPNKNASSVGWNGMGIDEKSLQTHGKCTE